MAKANSSGSSAISMPVDTLQSCFELLKEMFSCPVCHKLVRADPVHCVNQHFLCPECQGDLTECPTCQGEFSEQPLDVVSKVISVMPRKCSHDNCDMIVKPGNDHEKYCGFRKTECKKCDLKVLGKDIVDHMKREHPHNVIFPAINKALGKTIDPDLPFSFFTAFIAFDYFIWVRAENKPDDKRFTHTCYVVTNGKPAHDIYFKIIFSSKHSEFMRRIKINPNPDPESPDENTIDLPWSSLPDYLDTNRRLKLSIFFSGTKSESQ